MKKALIGSWIFFAAVLGGRALAEEVVQFDAFKQMHPFKVFWTQDRLVEHVVHLDDAEIQRIKEACK